MPPCCSTEKQDRVVVAVEPDLAHALHVARLLALAPQLRARPRPVMRLAGRRGALERLAVHPRERQHAPAPRVLRDRGDQPVGVPAHVVGERHQPHLDARRAHRGLGLRDRVLAVVEDRRGEHRVRPAGLDALDEVLEPADAARRDDRDVHRVGHRARELEVEALLRAVAVHAGQQDLAGAERGDLARPVDDVDAGRRAPAVDDDLPLVDGALLRVDRGDDALRAEVRGRLADELGVLHARGVDADLVGAGVEQRADVVDRVDAAADGERDEHLVGDRLDHLVEQAARLDARADVEERELVRALLVVAARDLDRVARVAQVDELDALDDAPGGDVEAGDDALREHGGYLPALPTSTACLKSSVPS
jgi:hypothetical protein